MANERMRDYALEIARMDDRLATIALELSELPGDEHVERARGAVAIAAIAVAYTGYAFERAATGGTLFSPGSRAGLRA